METNLNIIENNNLVKDKIIEFSYLFTILNKHLLLKNITLKTKLNLLKMLNHIIDLILRVYPEVFDITTLNIKNDSFNILSKHLSLIVKKYSTKTKTNKTRNRSLVSFSNRKLWKQKGTGRARAGSRNSPLFRGGGVVFGPTGYFTQIKINKKLKKKLFFASLILKLKNLWLLDLLDKSDIEQLSQKKVLLLTDNLIIEQKWLYSKYSNFKNINLKSIELVNSFDILKAEYILIKEESLFKLLKRLTLI